jgi:hypothetical protein
MGTFTIKVQRTYETTIKVEATDIDNAYELMSGGAFEDTINELELEQCNIVDTDYQIQEKPRTWARQCDVTGEGMNEGYIWHDGDSYTKYRKDVEAECVELADELIDGLESTNYSQQDIMIDDVLWKATCDRIKDGLRLPDDLLTIAVGLDWVYWTEWEDDDHQYIEINGVLTEIE